MIDNRIEIYKPVKGYEGLYEVSNKGNVKSVKRNKILKPGFNWNGYLLVGLCKGGNRKTYLVHRLVGEAFIPNPDGLPQINHKDECKTNNSVDNLEWCDSKYNINYSMAKSVSQYDFNGNWIATYPSLTEAATITKTNLGNISSTLTGRRNKAGGYYWTFSNSTLNY